MNIKRYRKEEIKVCEEIKEFLLKQPCCIPYTIEQQKQQSKQIQDKEQNEQNNKCIDTTGSTEYINWIKIPKNIKKKQIYQYKIPQPIVPKNGKIYTIPINTIKKKEDDINIKENTINIKENPNNDNILIGQGMVVDILHPDYISLKKSRKQFDIQKLDINEKEKAKILSIKEQKIGIEKLKKKNTPTTFETSTEEQEVQIRRWREAVQNSLYDLLQLMPREIYDDNGKITRVDMNTLQSSLNIDTNIVCWNGDDFY